MPRERNRRAPDRPAIACLRSRSCEPIGRRHPRVDSQGSDWVASLVDFTFSCKCCTAVATAKLIAGNLAYPRCAAFGITALDSRTLRACRNALCSDAAPSSSNESGRRMELRGAIAATDTIEVITLRGLVRYFVFFVADLKTRQIEIAGIVASPSRQSLDGPNRSEPNRSQDGFTSLPLSDRDPLFTKAFRAILESSSVQPREAPDP
jgi:hypothetical protein